MRPAWTSKLEDLANNLVGDISRIHWPTGEKIIHDKVWGTQSFESWEVAIIDLPLVQRLRHIHQTSLAYMTFPTALHTRFDHSLGVCSGTKKLAKEVLNLKKDEPLWHNLIAAALLHDIGHGPFSHLSEETYAITPGLFDELIYSVSGQTTPPYPKGSPHEVIGALLLCTTAVRRFFARLNDHYKIEIDPELVGNIIAGKGYPDNFAASNLVNGPYDADKIDYLRRDSSFSGIPIALDFDRLVHSLDKHDDPQSSRQELAIRMQGIVPAEHILFGKATLYSTVYHHHKVRAADCLFKGIIERILELKEGFNDRSFSDPADMLYFVDSDFTKWIQYQPNIEDKVLSHLLKKLSRRELPVRILQISNHTVEEGSLQNLLRYRECELSEANQEYNYIKSLRTKITKLVKSKFQVSDIDKSEVWIDLPHSPSLGDGTVITENGDLKQLSAVFPTKQWVEFYKMHKYVGYVIGPRRHKEILKKAAKEVLEQEGLIFNDPDL